jgi:alpha-amylase
MQNICLYFQVHQPMRLKSYRFFNIGSESNYFDENANAEILNKVALKCYLPTNTLLLKIINTNPDFKVSFSLSGVLIDQLELYAPEVLESFKILAKTGNVEFLGETYAHSLASVKSFDEFKYQVELHSNKIEELFNQKPTTFRNTELIFADYIAQWVKQLGFKTILTEGADKFLQWQSPNFLYQCEAAPGLNLLLKNYKLSDDIAFRFSDKNWSEYPLTADKYNNWLNNIDPSHQIVNLFMDYETFGEHQWEDTGIFDFLQTLPELVRASNKFSFITPSEVEKLHSVVNQLSIPYHISWADSERDLSAWLGNPYQDDTFEKLYSLEDKMKNVTDVKLKKDWLYLQTSDHFYYMCTKHFNDGAVHQYFNPFGNPFDAYIIFSNVLTDFENRINSHLNISTALKADISGSLEHFKNFLPKGYSI